MRQMTREEYLRVPYVLIVESVAKPDGAWLRRASYPELSGAYAEAESVIEAMEEADDLRVEIILDHIDRGIPVPVPRPPL
jgi:predicted RNase H-like HicB family nuclease